MLLAQLLAGTVDRYGDVGVARTGQPQQLLQVDLARGGVEQVAASHDVADSLKSVIDYHSQLVGKQAVLAQDDEITDLLSGILLLGPLNQIIEGNPLIG